MDLIRFCKKHEMPFWKYAEKTYEMTLYMEKIDQLGCQVVLGLNIGMDEVLLRLAYMLMKLRVQTWFLTYQ